ncbi:MAG: Gfo/Idh/MocA family oxidoreductase [Lentisphaeraceae bacterium]|nr:Gfo/Idh/MocA family oxidoreductase [Lentisphaeraceae bacterium]
MKDSKNFSLIGAAGYIAPRHMKAIKDTGNELVAAIDPFDSVGIIDSYFPEARFFTEIERFDRHLEKLRREGQKVDYTSICSPNYLHDAHIRLALRTGSHAICEKPLVINPWNLDALAELESEYKTHVYTILQLRLLPSMIALKEKFEKQQNRERLEVNLKYITRRGHWYQTSWKGDESKSGGVMMNIGIHFFDLMIWLFGDVQNKKVNLRTAQKSGGVLELEWARVNWFLSVDEKDLPEETRAAGKYAHRSMTIDGEELEFSAGFTDLHTRSYEEILAGRGFRIQDARKSVQLVHEVRTTDLN